MMLLLSDVVATFTFVAAANTLVVAAATAADTDVPTVVIDVFITTDVHGAAINVSVAAAVDVDFITADVQAAASKVATAAAVNVYFKTQDVQTSVTNVAVAAAVNADFITIVVHVAATISSDVFHAAATDAAVSVENDLASDNVDALIHVAPFLLVMLLFLLPMKQLPL